MFFGDEVSLASANDFDTSQYKPPPGSVMDDPKKNPIWQQIMGGTMGGMAPGGLMTPMERQRQLNAGGGGGGGLTRMALAMAGVPGFQRGGFRPYGQAALVGANDDELAVPVPGGDVMIPLNENPINRATGRPLPNVPSPPDPLNPKFGLGRLPDVAPVAPPSMMVDQTVRDVSMARQDEFGKPLVYGPPTPPDVVAQNYRQQGPIQPYRKQGPQLPPLRTPPKQIPYRQQGPSAPPDVMAIRNLPPFPEGLTESPPVGARSAEAPMPEAEPMANPQALAGVRSLPPFPKSPVEPQPPAPPAISPRPQSPYPSQISDAQARLRWLQAKPPQPTTLDRILQAASMFPIARPAAAFVRYPQQLKAYESQIAGAQGEIEQAQAMMDAERRERETKARESQSAASIEASRARAEQAKAQTAKLQQPEAPKLTKADEAKQLYDMVMQITSDQDKALEAAFNVKKAKDEGRKIRVVQDDYSARAVDEDTGEEVWKVDRKTRPPQEPREPAGSFTALTDEQGNAVFFNPRTGETVEAPQGTKRLADRPLSGEAAKVQSVAETMLPELQKLRDAASKMGARAFSAAVLGGEPNLKRLADQVADKVGRLRSGGAVNAQEEARFMGQIARAADLLWNDTDAILKALDGIKAEAEQVSGAMAKGRSPSEPSKKEDPAAKEVVMIAPPGVRGTGPDGKPLVAGQSYGISPDSVAAKEARGWKRK